MIKNWHTLPIPTRLVISYDTTDGTLRYERRAVIAFTIGDNDDLTYMSVYGMTYTKSKHEYAFVEQLQNGVWQS
jgi:hypothetical protein